MLCHGQSNRTTREEPNPMGRLSVQTETMNDVDRSKNADGREGKDISNTTPFFLSEGRFRHYVVTVRKFSFCTKVRTPDPNFNPFWFFHQPPNVKVLKIWSFVFLLEFGSGICSVYRHFANLNNYGEICNYITICHKKYCSYKQLISRDSAEKLKSYELAKLVGRNVGFLLSWRNVGIWLSWRNVM